MKKQGTTVRQTGILTASNMRQVSMGSVLGLVVGVGLRAFSRVLVVLFGMGIVAIEVRSRRLPNAKSKFTEVLMLFVVGCFQRV